MRKNKIIVDDAGAADAEPASGGPSLQVEKCAGRLASGSVPSGPALLVQESVDYPRKNSITESSHLPGSSPSKAAPLTSHSSLDFKKETPSCHHAVPLSHTRRSLCSREVPLIQIETDQREECVGESEHIISERSPLEEKERCLEEEKVSEAGKGEDAALSACQNPR